MRLRKYILIAGVIVASLMLCGGAAYGLYSLLKPTYPTLIESVRNADVEDVRKHLMLGKSPYEIVTLHYQGKNVQGPVVAAALCSRYPEMVEAFINKGFDVQKPLYFEMEDKSMLVRAPIYAAIEADTTGPLQTLLDHGAVVEPELSAGELSPLMMAVQLNKFGAARLLLEYGAEPNVRDSAGLTPLARAMAIDTKLSPEFTKLLCTHGAEVDAVDEQGMTPLHHACIYGNGETVILLIGFGAEVNRQDMNKRTPLHYASERAFSTLMKALLNAGADYMIKDKKQESVLQECIRIRQIPSVALLMEWKKEQKKKK